MCHTELFVALFRHRTIWSRHPQSHSVWTVFVVAYSIGQTSSTSLLGLSKLINQRIDDVFVFRNIRSKVPPLYWSRHLHHFPGTCRKVSNSRIYLIQKQSSLFFVSVFPVAAKYIWKSSNRIRHLGAKFKPISASGSICGIDWTSCEAILVDNVVFCNLSFNRNPF